MQSFFIKVITACSIMSSSSVVYSKKVHSQNVAVNQLNSSAPTTDQLDKQLSQGTSSSLPSSKKKHTKSLLLTAGVSFFCGVVSVFTAALGAAGFLFFGL